MPLNKEQMREYQRKRRAEKKGLGVKEAKVEADSKGIEMARSEGEVGVVATIVGREVGWGSVGPHGDDGDGPRWGPGVPVYIPSMIPQDEARIDPEGLNATDRTFAGAHPGRYVYAAEREEMCMLPSCMKKFKTRLALNRFCCFEHEQARLRSFSTLGLGK